MRLSSNLSNALKHFPSSNLLETFRINLMPAETVGSGGLSKLTVLKSWKLSKLLNVAKLYESREERRLTNFMIAERI